METLPLLSLPRHLPRQEWECRGVGSRGGGRFMSCPAARGSFAVSLCGGLGLTQASLYFSSVQTHRPVALPTLIRGPPVSISAMPAQDGKDRR